jgi:UDP-glucose 4-epimerase
MLREPPQRRCAGCEQLQKECGVAILVTGGAGYVGSIVTERLVEQGADVVVYDNLSQGHRSAVHLGARFIEGDLADLAQLESLFQRYEIDAVMHFAGHTLVGESFARPFRYLGSNVRNGLNLLETAVARGVRRFILSSTANLFDRAETMPIAPDSRVVPGSPYGESKYILERVLVWLERTVGLRYAALRYFNVAGASSRFGEDHDPETHLIPNVLRVALGQHRCVEVYGADYATPDGTCVRDYIHVVDLADAHLLALSALQHGSRVYNLGNGQGFSVSEVIDMARAVTGCAIPVDVRARRPGDPAVLIADATVATAQLGWRPRHGDLRSIVESAWRWHREHPNGYDD